VVTGAFVNHKTHHQCLRGVCRAKVYVRYRDKCIYMYLRVYACFFFKKIVLRIQTVPQGDKDNRAQNNSHVRCVDGLNRSTED
jgi:hypothetical protein